MLQARMFAYPDAQRYRIGGNFQALPVNRPKNETNNYQRDGALRFDGNHGGRDNFEPNDFGGPIPDPSVNEPPLKISGDADRYNSHAGNDDYSQAGALYNILTEEQKDRLTATIAGTMAGIPKALALKNVEHFKKCDPDYGSRIEKKIS
jgi:catalase